MADGWFECEGCNSWQRSHEKYKEMYIFCGFLRFAAQHQSKLLCILCGFDRFKMGSCGFVQQFNG